MTSARVAGRRGRHVCPSTTVTSNSASVRDGELAALHRPSVRWTRAGVVDRRPVDGAGGGRWAREAGPGAAVRGAEGLPGQQSRGERPAARPGTARRPGRPRARRRTGSRTGSPASARPGRAARATSLAAGWWRCRRARPARRPGPAFTRSPKVRSSSPVLAVLTMPRNVRTSAGQVVVGGGQGVAEQHGRRPGWRSPGAARPCRA